ncbi:HEPN domain-containing protein [Actinomycetaceae bacterium L2_0104]
MMANDPLNLDENGEWAGMWWLPEAPEEQVPGVLRYDSNDGLSLTLIGAFEDRIMSSPSPGMTVFHEGSRTWDVIHGAAEQRKITLLGCHPTNSKRTIGARVQTPDTQTVEAITVLIGAHIASEDEAVFRAAEVSVEDLGHWRASSIFEAVLGAPDGRPDGSGTISVKPVPAQSVVVDGTKFTLGHRHTLPFFDRRRGGTVGRVRDTTFVRVDPAEACSVEDAKDFARLVQDLIALATHRAAGVIWLRLKLAVGGVDSPSTKVLRDRDVDVIYSPSKVGAHDAKAIHQRHVFFTCGDIPFEEIIPRWCEVYERLRPALNMTLGLRYAPAQYIENNLLMAVGAAEVFHRGLRIDEHPMPPDEFEPMREAMLEHVPQEHRDRIKGSLRNDPTLRERLYALAARPDQKAMSSLVSDVDRWAQRTTRARNDLAHQGLTPKHSFEELIAIVDVTTAVVILNLLNEVGLPAERQRKIIQEHPQLRWIAQQADDQLRSPDA